MQEAARGPNLASTSRSAGSGGGGGEAPNAVSAGGSRWGEGGGASVQATPPKPMLADSPASMSELAQFPVGGKSGSTGKLKRRLKLQEIKLSL